MTGHPVLTLRAMRESDYLIAHYVRFWHFSELAQQHDNVG
jgi:hypothetical protein